MPKGKPMLVCGVEGCEYKHYDVRQLGRHKSKEHGVLSERAAKKGLVKLPNNPTIERVVVDNGIKIELIAYATGQLEGLLRNIAEQHGIPTKLFASRCAEYLLHSSRG